MTKTPPLTKQYFFPETDNNKFIMDFPTEKEKNMDFK